MSRTKRHRERSSHKIRRVLKQSVATLLAMSLIGIAGWALVNGDNVAAVMAIVGSGLLGRRF